MLDSELTGGAPSGAGQQNQDDAAYDGGTSQAATAAAEGAVSQAEPPKRRRRAASRPAGPPEPAPVEAQPDGETRARSTDSGSASGAALPAPAGRAGEGGAGPEAADGAGAASEGDAEPPKRSRRTRKRTQAPPADGAEQPTAGTGPVTGPVTGAATDGEGRAATSGGTATGTGLGTGLETSIDTVSAAATAKRPAEAPDAGEAEQAAADKPKRRRTRKKAETAPESPAETSTGTGAQTSAEASAGTGAGISPDTSSGGVTGVAAEAAGTPTGATGAVSGEVGGDGHGAGIGAGHGAVLPPQVTFQAPTVVFQPPDPEPSTTRRTRKRGETAETETKAEPETATEAKPKIKAETRAGAAERLDADAPEEAVPLAEDEGDEGDERSSRRRRRGGRGRRGRKGEGAEAAGAEGEGSDQPDSAAESDDEGEDSDEETSTRRRRRRRRRGTAAEGVELAPDDPPNTVVKVREPRRGRGGGDDADEVQSVKGSTRLEAKKQRRREGREQGRRRPPIISEAEFLARRESVERVMVVRQISGRTQIAVLEDGVLVEHYVNRETSSSYVGNVYLGKVQNVLPSMEAAFVDIGKGRNAVLYAGEVNFDAAGLEGQPKRIESALKSGQSVLVQVTKDPMGHKGARLTSQISLPGRYLVYVPDGSMTGISRKLPDTERSRLKSILKKVVPENAGVIVRTAAEGASEEELSRDVARLAAQWEDIRRKAQTASSPALLYGEPDLTVRVIRDVFNEDFSSLVVAGDEGWQTVYAYVEHVAPDLLPRVSRWTPERDVFAEHRVDEQLMKALDRKVWLPSGGSLVIDRTEAMVVVDVNTGKFTGKGGNLEETVTKNNLEAAEEIVRQLRLRDLGGIIVIDFIDMVLENNRELVLRRLLECLGRDRTKHQVAEVTSLGLVQMTRKRVGQGLLEAFSEPCEHCNGRGVHVRMEQLEAPRPRPEQDRGRRRRGKAGDRSAEPAAAEPAATEPAATEPRLAEVQAAAPQPAETQPAETQLAGTQPAEIVPAHAQPADTPAAETWPGSGGWSEADVAAAGAGSTNGRLSAEVAARLERRPGHATAAVDAGVDTSADMDEDEDLTPRDAEDTNSVAEALEPDVELISDDSGREVSLHTEVQSELQTEAPARRAVKRATRKAAEPKAAAKKPATKRATKRGSAAPTLEPE